MANANANKTETTKQAATPAKKTRIKSQESILKQSMTRINKEIDALDAKISAFEVMEQQMTTVEADRDKLFGELNVVKTDLIKELGLD